MLNALMVALMSLSGNDFGVRLREKDQDGVRILRFLRLEPCVNSPLGSREHNFTRTYFTGSEKNKYFKYKYSIIQERYELKRSNLEGRRNTDENDSDIGDDVTRGTKHCFCQPLSIHNLFYLYYHRQCLMFD